MPLLACERGEPSNWIVKRCHSTRKLSRAILVEDVSATQRTKLGVWQRAAIFSESAAVVTRLIKRNDGREFSPRI